MYSNVKGSIELCNHELSRRHGPLNSAALEELWAAEPKCITDGVLLDEEPNSMFGEGPKPSCGWNA
ncbi:hypothetical protein ACP70R_023783 [Stipagrostis hirtigluma subsp. patula]